MHLTCTAHHHPVTEGPQTPNLYSTPPAVQHCLPSALGMTRPDPIPASYLLSSPPPPLPSPPFPPPLSRTRREKTSSCSARSRSRSASRSAPRRSSAAARPSSIRVLSCSWRSCRSEARRENGGGVRFACIRAHVRERESACVCECDHTIVHVSVWLCVLRYVCVIY